MPLVQVVRDCMVLGHAYPRSNAPIHVGALTASIMRREGWAVDVKPEATQVSGHTPPLQQKVLFWAPERKG